MTDRGIPELTLRDVISHMDGRFTRVEDRLGGVEERLGGVEHRLGKVEGAVLDLQEDVSSALKAIDKDAVMLLDHKRRITRLEKT